jgi:cystathionine beta-lyase/cystathionine gamma-synthase
MAKSNGYHKEQQYRPDTLAIHADDRLNHYTDIAPALHVSTTFRYDNANLNPTGDEEVRQFFRRQIPQQQTNWSP